MKLEGVHLIGNKKTRSDNNNYYAFNPELNKRIGPAYSDATEEEVNMAVILAENSFQNYKNKTGSERADFLYAIGEEINNLGMDLIDYCHKETALPVKRLEGERDRTVSQINMFADMIKEGSWRGARIDVIKKATGVLDLRYSQIPLGPVAVFGSSNFPLAFSVAGGDTISAFAAGCPVVFKAHFAHPGTSEMVGKAILKAAMNTNMPEGVFSMVHGNSNNVGMALVKHPLIKAIGFTGSFKGGKAIFDVATNREEPIPVYAEMGSINPVFFLPEIINERAEELAQEYVDSITLGNGQFCTNPGISFLFESKESDIFIEKTTELLNKISCGIMLTKNIQTNYDKGIINFSNFDDVTLLTDISNKSNESKSNLFLTDVRTYLKNRNLSSEIFGPSSLIVKLNNRDELFEVLRAFKGFLTISINGTRNDLNEFKEMFSYMGDKAGRLIINGFPTGVEVCHSMNHGGPFPATTDVRSTSVGTSAIFRFVRPISYQNFPDELLPDELKDNNPLKIWRLTNGKWDKSKN